MRFLIRLLSTLLLLPVLLILWLALLCFNLLYHLTLFARRRLPADSPPISGLASIVILNWNGKDLLAEGLPSVLKAVQVDGRPHEVLVVDNGSSDGSIEYVQTCFPEVRILILPENLGFAEGNNRGVQAAGNDVVVLLNNDMVVDPGFLRPLFKEFGPKTFAVSSQIFHQDASKRREETGKTTAVFRRGMIDYSHRNVGSGSLPRSCYPALWAGGGSSAFHRQRFLSLGGFQSMYSPAYVEDTDISYQAWQAGWEVLFAPESVVYHKHRASSSRRFSPSALQILIKRNQFLFIWKNIHSWKHIFSHGIFLPWNCYRLMRDYGAAVIKSLFQAIARIPQVERARLCSRFRPVRTDSQIFELFQKPGLFFSLKRPSLAVPESKPRVLWLTAYLPHTGRHAGAGRMFQLLKRISLNYRITLLTFLETDSEREFLSEVEPYCEKLVALKRSHPMRRRLFAYEPFDEFLTREMQEAADQYLEDYDFDLIQFEYTQMAGYAGHAAGIPSILTKHEVDFAACARRAKQESSPLNKFRWLYNYLQVLDREVKLTRNVDAVICMTDPDAQELRKYCPSVPVYVINTGVDLDYFKPPEQPAAGFRMVFVGAFQHLPNVEAMVYFCSEILPMIRDRAPEVELYIVGSHPPQPVMSLSAIPGVHVTGFVPDIRPFMAESSVYIVPLRLGVGIRGKILEAWSMSMPVVTTSVGCAGLRCQNDKNLLIADAKEQFALQTLSLLKDPQRRRRLGDEGRKTVERHYGWDNSAQQLDVLYQRCLAARKHDTHPSH